MASMERYERASRRRTEVATFEAAASLLKLAKQPGQGNPVDFDCGTASFENGDVSAPTHVDAGAELDHNACNGTESQTEITSNGIKSLQEELQRIISENIQLKEKLGQKEMTENFFEGHDERVRFFTGLNSYTDLMLVFNFVKNHITACARSAVEPFQQLILTLMKLRHNFPLQDLAIRFDTSKSTCSKIFLKVLDILYNRIKWNVRWPTREELQLTMPMCFREHFGTKVSVIIDCFEVFLDRPTNLLARAQTWSSYKHHNTLKFLIGITPQGCVSYISKGWGGRVSDKYIAEHCGILTHILPGDLVMADRGFNIHESVGLAQGKIVVPSFMGGKKQLTTGEVVATRKIANVRIHVERVIGLVRRKYTILRGPIPVQYVKGSDENNMTTIDKIAVVCCALCNFCPAIVSFD